MNKKYIIITIVLLAISALSYVAYAYFFDGTGSVASAVDTFIKKDGNKQSGALYIGNAEEIKAQLQKETDKSYMSYKMNTNPVFKTGSSMGNLMIENVKGNPNIVQVTIELESTGKVVYVSPALNPNESVQEDKLDENLKKGKYAAIAYFKCYDSKTEELVGVAGLKINLTITN